ncbi:MAG: PAS domain S-box protein, partial [bacterium]
MKKHKSVKKSAHMALRKHRAGIMDDENCKFKAAILDNAEESVIAMDREGSMLYLNKKAARARGYSRKELLGKNISVLNPLAKKSFIRALFNKIIKNRFIKFYGEHVAKGGKKIPVEVVSRCIKLGGKNIIIAAPRDITERRKAEAAIGESKEKFRLAFEYSHDPIFWADTQTGILINCNRAAENIMEAPRRKIIGKPTTWLHPPEMRDYYAEFFRSHVREHVAVDREAVILSRSGRQIPVYITAVVFKIGKKNVIQGVFRDMTAHKKAEQALKESEERYRDLFENVDDMIQSVGPDGRFIYVNTAWKKNLGYADGRIKKLCFSDTVSEENAEHCTNAFRELREGRSFRNFRAVFKAK